MAAAYEVESHSAWGSYRPRAHAFADWLVAAYKPSIFVVPSDAIFYLRPVIERLDVVGIPTAVVQKETSISPLVLEEHSQAVGQSVPFVSRVMTVCSERHKTFWVRSGADPDRIVVTGQPRFDVYVHEPRRARGSPPMLLYLSYDDVAYLPSDTGVPFEGSWRDLRLETEAVLHDLALAGRWRVVAKPHPQQPTGDDKLGEVVIRADRDADTRELILDADAVVGFQTTALYEATVAGKPVVYPAWGPVFEANRSILLPFHDQPELAVHVKSREELHHVLTSGADALPSPGASARALAEEQLGPVDGGASDRVLAVLRQHAATGLPKPMPPTPFALARAFVLGAGAPLSAAAGTVMTGIGRPSAGVAMRRRAQQWKQEAAEARAIRRSG